MPIIPVKCTTCGANVEIDDTKEVTVCQHCGTSFLVERTVNNYTINNINIIKDTDKTPTFPKPTISIKKQQTITPINSTSIPTTNNKPINTNDSSTNCKVCGMEYSGSFCPNCGTQRTILCRKCGAECKGDFCVACGSKIKKGGKLLGFRSNTIWKKIISILCLIFIPLSIIGNLSSMNSMYDFVTILEIFLMFAIPYACLSNFSLRNRLPFFKKHKASASAIGLIIAYIIVFAFCSIINPATHCDHEWNETITTEATCTTTGQKDRHCDLCDKDETVTIDSLEHKFEIKKETETEIIKVCSVCNEEISEIKENKTEIKEEIETETRKEQTAEKTENTTIQTKYMTEGSWALEGHYAFAVEIDNYNGDIFEAGTYRFYPEAVLLVGHNSPVVWDIYVSDKVYNNISELHDDNKDFVGCVGGWDKDELTVTLKEGQYVYVKYYKPANNKPTGYLQIEKTN